MRLTLKQQILLAPATVLLLLALLLGYLQFTYWDLSVKRQEAIKLKASFIAMAEADLASRRMAGLLNHPDISGSVDLRRIAEMSELHTHLAASLRKVLDNHPLKESERDVLRRAIADLDPQLGFDADRFRETLDRLRPYLTTIFEQSQEKRDELRSLLNQDITELVSSLTLVTITVLGVAILFGIFLSLTFARGILRRIRTLSASAGRIVAGDLTPTTPPAQIRDELDDLSRSVSRMTDRLIRVVGSEKLLEGAEEERRRIARDIHDQTLSDLSAILRGVQELRSCGGCMAAATLLEDDLRRAIGNLREVMDNLHPQSLDILGLAAAIESYLERHLSRDGLPNYHYYASPDVGEIDLDRQTQLSLYRIALEAVHNVVRHAAASRYEVVLERRERELLLSVEDNGRGFTPDPGGGGRGLNNIRERSRLIGAQVSWKKSRFTSGTRFEVSLPLPTTD